MDTSVLKLNGIGPKRAQLLAKLNIHTVGDLMYYKPVDYRDVRHRITIAEAEYDTLAVFNARVANPPRFTSIPGRRITVLRVRLQDETGQIDAVFFNSPYLKNTLKEGTEWRFCGKVNKSGAKLIINPEFEKIGLEDAATLIPIYRLTSGISQNMMRQHVRSAFEFKGKLGETLDEQTLRDYNLMPLNMALYRLHYPRDEKELQDANRRLAFEKLLNYQLAMGIRRQQRFDTRRGITIHTDWNVMNTFMRSLPYRLTQAQMLTISEVLDDMEGIVPMNRLIQGDVGSGKTVVAAMAMLSVAMSGHQALFMAPTEMLARQHFEKLTEFYRPFGINVGLFTGSLSRSERKNALKAIVSGEYNVVVGTHALISDDVVYNRLALVVTDEQHRFGVSQRTLAMNKAETPHVLVMSATPIPRTLSLVLYSDLDISIINELPEGRIPVNTRIVSEYRRRDMYSYIRTHIKEGERCYVVCPLVEESDKIQARSAEEVYEELCDNMPKDTVGIVHGKMNADKKKAALEDFISGKRPILVSTTVIEVGIDVPEATMMVIENASRFGLATLHQLRGRVGRNDKQCWCFLISGDDSDEASKRLNILVSTNDGFEIAKKDLELRGPGQMFGTRQHGSADDEIISYAGNTELVKETKDAAQSLLLREDTEAHRVVAGALTEFDELLKNVALN